MEVVDCKFTATDFDAVARRMAMGALLVQDLDDALRRLAPTGVVSRYQSIDALEHRGEIVHREPQDRPADDEQ